MPAGHTPGQDWHWAMFFISSSRLSPTWRPFFSLDWTEHTQSNNQLRIHEGGQRHRCRSDTHPPTHMVVGPLAASVYVYTYNCRPLTPIIHTLMVAGPLAANVYVCTYSRRPLTPITHTHTRGGGHLAPRIYLHSYMVGGRSHPSHRHTYGDGPLATSTCMYIRTYIHGGRPLAAITHMHTSARMITGSPTEIESASTLKPSLD